MAESRVILGSANVEPESNSLNSKADYLSNSISNGKYDVSVIRKSLKFAWIGDLESIKSLVSDYLDLSGEWVSPGGERKVFNCGGRPTITWMNKKKLLSLEGPNTEFIQRKLTSVLQLEDTAKATNPLYNSHHSSDVANCSPGCGCSCKELAIELEGVKLDMAIVESKNDRAIGSNSHAIDEVKSEVNKLLSEVERTNCMVSELISAKSKSNTKEDEELSRSIREENEVLQNTVEALTLELCKLKTSAVENSCKSADNVVITYANSVADGALLTETTQSSNLLKSCTSTSPKSFSFEDQLDQYAKRHRISRQQPDVPYVPQLHIQGSRLSMGRNIPDSQTTPISFKSQMEDYIQKHKSLNNVHRRKMSTKVIRGSGHTNIRKVKYAIRNKGSSLRQRIGKSFNTSSKKKTHLMTRPGPT